MGNIFMWGIKNPYVLGKQISQTGSMLIGNYLFSCRAYVSSSFFAIKNPVWIPNNKRSVSIQYKIIIICSLLMVFLCLQHLYSSR